MSTSVLFVLNPASGQHDADATEAEVASTLADAGHDVEVRRTEGEGDARDWAGSAADDGVDLVVVAGGDGTVREAVSGIVRSTGDVPLAVIPMGTANLFARALGIPVDDVAAAAEVAAGRQCRRIDVLHLVDRDEHALMMVDAGFDARLVRDASRGLKNVLGAFAYVAAGLRNTVGLTSAGLALEVDGETRAARGHSVLCLNVGRIGETVVVAEDIELDDGRLHVGVVQAARPWSVLWTALGMAVARRDAQPNVEWFACEHLRLHADPPLDLHVDGDAIEGTPVELRLLPSAVAVVVP